MHYPKQIKEKCFKLYIKGYSLSSISKMDGMPAMTTLAKWCKTEGWEAYRETAELEASKALMESATAELAEMDKRHIQGLLVATDRITEMLRSDKITARNLESLVRALSLVMREARLLKGEATERIEANTENFSWKEIIYAVRRESEGE